MSRREKQMTVEMRRELDAIDIVLRGEAVAPAYAPLEELVRSVERMRPHPSEEFVAALDRRAAHAFKRESSGSANDSPLRRRTPGGARQPWLVAGHTRMRVAALGLVVTVALAAVVSVPLLRSGGGAGPLRAEPRRTGPAVSGPAVSAPARLTSRAPTAARGNAGGATNGASSAASTAPGAAARQVERTSALDVGVASVSLDTTAQRVFTLASAYNGYVRQSNVSSGPVGQGGATFDVRLPSSNLAAAIASLSHLGHVRSENDTTNDVTDQVGALHRTAGDQRALRASLLRQLAQATDPARVASLKAQLHAVEARIAQLQAELRALTNRVDYTRLALSLTPEVAAGASSGDLTPGGAAHDAGQILSAAFAVLVIAAAAVVPVAAVVIAGWALVARARRRLREQALDAS